jgi:hypothetical protein
MKEVIIACLLLISLMGCVNYQNHASEVTQAASPTFDELATREGYVPECVEYVNETEYSYREERIEWWCLEDHCIEECKAKIRTCNESDYHYSAYLCERDLNDCDNGCIDRGYVCGRFESCPEALQQEIMRDGCLGLPKIYNETITKCAKTILVRYAEDVK